MAVVSDFIDVLRAEADLGVCDTVALGVGGAEQVGDHGLHPGTSEERGRVLLRNHIGPRNDFVGATREEFEVCSAYVAGFHGGSIPRHFRPKADANDVGAR